VIDPHFVWLGAALSMLGAASYCRETLHGRVRPNRVSWLLWAVAPLIAFAAQVSDLHPVADRHPLRAHSLQAAQ
jgi:hypothetical protein